MIEGMLRLLILAIALGSSAAAQEPISLGHSGTEQDNARRPVIVLKNGHTLRPETATVKGDRVTLRFADSTTRTYPKSAIVFEESLGITHVDSLKKNMKKSDLSTYAASIKLQKSAADSTGTITIVGAGKTPNIGSTEIETVQEPEEDDALLLLSQSAANLKSAWSRYQSFKTHVDTRCRDYRYGRAGGQRYVIPAIETAECKDAIRQLRARLPSLRSDYNKLTLQSRRDEIEAGKLRDVLSANGLLNFPTLLSQEDRFLESLLK